MSGGGDQRVGDVERIQRFVGAAIGQETAFTVSVDERDQPPGLAIGRRRDAARRHRLEPRCLAFDISCADAGDEIDFDAKRGEPHRLIAADPPGQTVIDARRSEPRAIGPSGRTMMSVITSPIRRMRERRSPNRSKPEVRDSRDNPYLARSRPSRAIGMALRTENERLSGLRCVPNNFVKVSFAINGSAGAS